MAEQDKEMNEQEEKLFIKGFNAGYVIEKENPKLLKQLTAEKQNENNPYVKGIVAGSKEQQREKYLAEYKAIRKKAKSKDKEQDR
jgi:hypothetical protein